VAGKSRTVEERIAWIADRAQGVVAWRDLLAAGVSRDEIDHRRAIGALRRVHEGVYRVGPLTTEARYMAAVKTCGRGRS
jgi:predicted transcriptional regulator of viral defense system